MKAAFGFLVFIVRFVVFFALVVVFLALALVFLALALAFFFAAMWRPPCFVVESFRTLPSIEDE